MTTDVDASIVARQLDREPRTPWRVAWRCAYGYPGVIASPSVLDDGDRFPTTYYLTCPFLASSAARLESEGEVARWRDRLDGDAALTARLRAADEELRARRAAESGGIDATPDVGLAGQADVLGVKCLHAHVAYALVGIDDPIGASVLAETGDVCPDARCARLTEEA